MLVSSDEKRQEQVNSATSKADMVLGLMKNIFSSWSDVNFKIIYPAFVKLYSTSRLLHQSGTLTLNTTQKHCPAQSNPHERISPLTFRRESQKARFNRLENTMSKRFLHPYLQTCSWSR